MYKKLDGQGILITLLETTLGINNVAPPYRLAHDHEKGITELLEAVNVDVLSNGVVARRRGFTEKISLLDAHSLFASGEDCLFVAEGSLCRMLADEQVVSLCFLTSPSLKMYYVKVGELVFYSNGIDMGVVRGNVRENWTAPEYNGPETVRTFSTPPPGKNLTLYHGRIYAALGTVVWYTEYMQYYFTDLANNFMLMPSAVLDIADTDDGLWISTETELNFYKGASLLEFSRIEAECAPMISGSFAKVPAGVLQQQGIWHYATNRDGIHLLGPSGQMVNVTKDRFVAGEGTSATATCFNGKYIVTID